GIKAQSDTRSLRVGIAVAQFAAEIDPSVQQAVADAEATFHAIGFPPTRFCLDDVEMLNELQQILVRCEAAALYGRLARERRHGVSPFVARMVEDALMLPAARYIEALTLRPKLLAAFVREV